MNGRIYSVGFKAVTLAAVQDLFGIYAGASMAAELHSVKLAQFTLTAIGSLALRLRKFPTTVTSGSGGSSVTPASLRTTDAAATVTARVNDTTQASTSGTAADMPDGWDIPFGYLWLPPEADRPIIKPGEAFIVSLDTAPSSVVASGTLVFRELY